MEFSRIVIALTATLLCVAASAAPYAPAGKAVEAFVAVPDASTVGIPAYPGARIYSSMGPIDPQAKNSTLILYTADPKEKVLQFYKEKLKDWTVGQIEQTGDPLIHEGQGELDPFGAEGKSTRHVLVGDGIEPMGRTRITIGYHKVEEQDKNADQSGEDAEKEVSAE